MTDQFFKTPFERDNFFHKLHRGEMLVSPGCWFRHAINAPKILDDWLYDDYIVLSDCSIIAANEVAGITGKRLDRLKLSHAPIFRQLFAAMRTGGLEGLRTVLIQFATEYDPVTNKNVVTQEIPPASPEAIQKWASLFAEFAVKQISSEVG